MIVRCSIATLFALILILIAPISLSIPCVAELGGSVTVHPHQMYQGVETEYLVNYTNLKDVNVEIVKVNVTVDWPGEPSEGFFDPDETHTIFEGSQTIAPGSTFTFSKEVTSGFFGSFTIIIQVEGKAEGDQNYSVETFHDSATFLSKPYPYYWYETATLFILLVLFFFGISMLSFFFALVWWDFEIRRNLEQENLSMLQTFKWFPFLWYRRGRKLRVFLFCLAYSSVLAGIILIAIT